MLVTILIMNSSMNDTLDLMVFPLSGGADFDLTVSLADVLAVEGGEMLEGYTPGDRFRVEFDKKSKEITRVIQKEGGVL